MTKREAIAELSELEITFPIKPYTPEEKQRALETEGRIAELFRYIYCDGPEPAPEWAPTTPAPTGAERDRYIIYWTDLEMDELKQMMASMGLSDGGEAAP